MINIFTDPTRLIVIITGLQQRDAAEAAARARRHGAAWYSDLNELQPDGSVCLTVSWDRMLEPDPVAGHPDGPPELRGFLRDIDGWSSAVLVR